MLTISIMIGCFGASLSTKQHDTAIPDITGRTILSERESAVDQAGGAAQPPGKPASRKMKKKRKRTSRGGSKLPATLEALHEALEHAETERDAATLNRVEAERDARFAAMLTETLQVELRRVEADRDMWRDKYQQQTVVASERRLRPLTESHIWNHLLKHQAVLFMDRKKIVKNRIVHLLREDHGARFDKTTGDGDCLVHSFCRYLEGHESDKCARRVRSDIVKYTVRQVAVGHKYPHPFSLEYFGPDPPLFYNQSKVFLEGSHINAFHDEFQRNVVLFQYDPLRNSLDRRFFYKKRYAGHLPCGLLQTTLGEGHFDFVKITAEIPLMETASNVDGEMKPPLVTLAEFDKKFNIREIVRKGMGSKPPGKPRSASSKRKKEHKSPSKPQ